MTPVKEATQNWFVEAMSERRSLRLELGDRVMADLDRENDGLANRLEIHWRIWHAVQIRKREALCG